MVSPYVYTHGIFSFIHEGADAFQIAGYYLFRVIIGNPPSMRKSQNQLPPGGIFGARDSADATL